MPFIRQTINVKIGDTRFTAATELSPAEEISAVISMLMSIMDRESRIKGSVMERSCRRVKTGLSVSAMGYPSF